MAEILKLRYSEGGDRLSVYNTVYKIYIKLYIKLSWGCGNSVLNTHRSYETKLRNYASVQSAENNIPPQKFRKA